MAPKHILILFCDQLRADCIGACGNEEIQTPAMDALVADSTAYDRCITPSPVCVPARLSLLQRLRLHTGDAVLIMFALFIGYRVIKKRL